MHLEILNEERKYELFEQKVFVVTSSPRLNLKSQIPATRSCSSQSNPVVKKTALREFRYFPAEYFQCLQLLGCENYS